MVIFLAILLCSFGTQINGDNNPVSADLGLHHNQHMQGDSRLLLNPFSIFGNPPCEYNGVLGTCYGEVECLALAGTYGNFCPGLQGLCCLFYRTCGQRTSQEVAYFRNVQYPLNDRLPDACSFQIIKRSDEYCGLKVTMEKAKLPAKNNGECDEAYFQVTGIHNDRLSPKCGTLTGKQYLYSMINVDELQIHMKSARATSVSWNLKVDQVKCSKWVGEDFGDEDEDIDIGGGGSGSGTGGGGSGTGGGGSIGTSTKPTPVFPPTFPPIVGPPAPPTTGTTQPPTVFPGTGGTGGSSTRCGVRGPSFGQGTRGQTVRRLLVEGPLGPDVSKITGRRRKTPNRNRRPGVVSDNRRPIRRPADNVTGSVATNGVVTSLDWAVPTLDDTLFAHYAGEPSPFSTRITYGQVAGTREFPWNIAMTIRGKFHCGASLISNYHVLTAAHCVISYKNTPNSIDLSLGDWDLTTTNDGRNVKAKVSRITVHPSYSRATLQNDLAVLKLAQRVEFNDRIKPICLPDSNLGIEGKQAIVSGWGRNEDKKLQSQLHHLRATVVSNVLCDQRWNSNGAARGFIVQSMMCMDSTSGDSCNGDSGGPSIYEHPPGSGTYVQVGIVSFGSGSCTDASLPGVYTRVSHYKNWIQQQMN